MGIKTCQPTRLQDLASLRANSLRPAVYANVPSPPPLRVSRVITARLPHDQRSSTSRVAARRHRCSPLARYRSSRTSRARGTLASRRTSNMGSPLSGLWFPSIHNVMPCGFPCRAQAHCLADYVQTARYCPPPGSGLAPADHAPPCSPPDTACVEASQWVVYLDALGKGDAVSIIGEG
jgi:hypothetical protein